MTLTITELLDLPFEVVCTEYIFPILAVAQKKGSGPKSAPTAKRH